MTCSIFKSNKSLANYWVMWNMALNCIILKVFSSRAPLWIGRGLKSCVTWANKAVTRYFCHALQIDNTDEIIFLSWREISQCFILKYHLCSSLSFCNQWLLLSPTLHRNTLDQIYVGHKFSNSNYRFQFSKFTFLSNSN